MGTHNFKEETGEMQFDASGFLKVNVAAGAAAGGTSMTDDAAFTPATTAFTPAGGIVTADSVDAGDGGAFAMLANRQQKVTLYDSAGVELAVGGGTQYTEDAVAAANPVGNAQILVRQDTPATLVTTDGDNVARRGTNYGAAFSQIVTSAGAFVDTFGGGTQYTEDVASAADPVGTALIMVRADTPAAVTNTDGDNIAARATNKGELYVKHIDAIPVTQSGVWDEVGINDSGNSITIDNSTLSVVGGGVEATALRVTIASDSTGVLSVDDNGGSITVDGTVAVTGVSTLAEQQTQTTHLATIAGDTTDIEAAVELLDDTVAVLGTTTYTEAATKGLIIGAIRRDADTTLVDTTNEVAPLQVDARGFLKAEVFSGEALPVTLTSTTITGTVAVTQSGTWDEVGINDSGNSITVDNPTLSVVGGGVEATALRVTIASDSTGLLSIDDNGGSITVDGTVSVTGVATEVTLASLLTSSQLIDDSIVTLGTATYTETTSVGQAIAAVRRDADTTLVGTTNEWGPLQMDANGRLKVEAFSGETLPVSLTSTTITGQVTIGDGTDAIDVLAAGSDNVANTENQLITAAVLYAYDGSAFDRVTIGGGTEATALRVTLASDSTGLISIDDNGGSLTVDAPIGTPVNVQIGNGTLAAGVIDETGAAAVDALAVGGGTAHDAVDSGNPVKVGYRAVAHSANPTAVAAADRTHGIANRAGIPFVMAGHPNVVTVRANYTAAQTDTAVVTVAAGLKIVVTRCSVTADNANTVDTAVRIGFGAVNTPSATGVVLSHPGIAPGSGVVEGTGSGMIGVGADDEDLRITSEVPTTGSIDVVVTYYTIES